MPHLQSRLIATAFFAFLLIVGSAFCAEDPPPFPPDQWRTVTGYMSPEEYRKAYRHNQRLLRDAVKSYSTDALRSAGVPETGIRLMSAAAGLAVDGEARLYLNSNRRNRLALEFTDVTDRDRSVLLGIRWRW